MYVALFAVLAFNFAVSLRSTLGLGYGLTVFVATLQVGLPMLLSGIVSRRSFQQAEDPGAALGANLMGAVLGALLEYSSLIFGLRLLYVDALVFYLISFVIITRSGLRAGQTVGIGDGSCGLSQRDPPSKGQSNQSSHVEFHVRDMAKSLPSVACLMCRRSCMQGAAMFTSPTRWSVTDRWISCTRLGFGQTWKSCGSGPNGRVTCTGWRRSPD